MYDLEERTLNLAIAARNFVKELPKTLSNLEDAKQLVRSSGSMGANYIEANESLSRKVRLIKSNCHEMPLFVKPLQGIALVGVTFRNST
jgi:hypothetical protein